MEEGGVRRCPATQQRTFYAYLKGQCFLFVELERGRQELAFQIDADECEERVAAVVGVLE